MDGAQRPPAGHPGSHLRAGPGRRDLPPQGCRPRGVRPPARLGMAGHRLRPRPVAAGADGFDRDAVAAGPARLGQPGQRVHDRCPGVPRADNPGQPTHRPRRDADGVPDHRRPRRGPGRDLDDAGPRGQACPDVPRVGGPGPAVGGRATGPAVEVDLLKDDRVLPDRAARAAAGRTRHRRIRDHRPWAGLLPGALPGPRRRLAPCAGCAPGRHRGGALADPGRHDPHPAPAVLPRPVRGMAERL